MKGGNNETFFENPACRLNATYGDVNQKKKKKYRHYETMTIEQRVGHLIHLVITLR